METTVCLGIGTLTQIFVPVVGLLALGVWYYLNLMTKIKHLEQSFTDLDERLVKIEDRLTEALVRLENKLDRYIYARAARLDDSEN